MPEANNIDSKLIQAMNGANEQPQAAPAPDASSPNNDEASKLPENDNQTSDSADNLQKEPEKSPDESFSQNEDNNKKTADSPIDEYGNPIEKPKMYSEDDVQKIIRDRLSRNRSQPESRVSHEVREETKGFKPDEQSEKPWQEQLEEFIDHAIEKKNRKAAEENWRIQEEKKHADFEARFTSGMQKYADFHETVRDKPITDSMMLATRALENPAAFIYAACKLHPQEIQKIAQINDPYAQAAAVGRLHEKMIKNRPVSQAPRPLQTPQGDVPQKTTITQPSIDQRIESYAKAKRK